ncbi:hypothetical protein D2Q93_15135 [Alicyclobacillaceae bacterium I2511]|nr:hypothetical protein D2Q93_15135 [Alicyclobacillaceae bacterium I2511]
MKALQGLAIESFENIEHLSKPQLNSVNLITGDPAMTRSVLHAVELLGTPLSLPVFWQLCQRFHKERFSNNAPMREQAMALFFSSQPPTSQKADSLTSLSVSEPLPEARYIRVTPVAREPMSTTRTEQLQVFSPSGLFTVDLATPPTNQTLATDAGRPASVGKSAHQSLTLLSEYIAQVGPKIAEVRFTEVLQMFDPGIARISVPTLSVQEVMIEHQEVGVVPVVLSAGLRRVLTMAAVALQHPDSVLLIDGVDASAQPGVFLATLKWLHTLANDMGLQIFAVSANPSLVTRHRSSLEPYAGLWFLEQEQSTRKLPLDREVIE